MKEDEKGKRCNDTPNAGNANNARNVNTTGSVSNNNALNANGAVLDCGILARIKVDAYI